MAGCPAPHVQLTHAAALAAVLLTDQADFSGPATPPAAAVEAGQLRAPNAAQSSRTGAYGGHMVTSFV